MALYHLHVDQIKRSQGRSSVACAAYRAGEKLYDDYYGEQKNYSRKGGVILSEIHLPPHAPRRFFDRETLWNELEWTETNKKAQLAHSYDIALMNEFTLEENIELVRRFVEEQFISRGMIVDLAVHDPDRNGGIPNPHIHIMVPIRPLNPDGSWGIKEKKIPLLDEDGNPVYGKNGKPKMAAVSVTGWSSKETLLAIRQAWAEINNELFAKKGLDICIDWRSYEEQGIHQIPTIHEGPAVRKMEARGVETELGKLNRMIRAVNKILAGMKEMRQWFRDKVEALTEALNEIPEPNLRGFLLEYYRERDRVAETFQYGTQKAQLHNMQELTHLCAYLGNNNIDTPSDLDEKIRSLESAFNALGDQLKEKRERLKTLSKQIQKEKQYRENWAIGKEYEKKIFMKKQFYQEHGKEIRSFKAAERFLEPLRTAEGKIPLGQWRKEADQIAAEIAQMEAEQQELLPDLKTLRKIQRIVDDALRIEKPDQGDELDVTEQAENSKANSSIHKRLKEKKELVANTSKKNNHRQEWDSL